MKIGPLAYLKIGQSRFQILPVTLLTLNNGQMILNFAKVARFRQILSHWFPAQKGKSSPMTREVVDDASGLFLNPNLIWFFF